MSYLQVKVCGITRPQDGALAASLGADMIGMIFYRGSRRFLTLADARRVVAALPPTVDRVGVFVDESYDRMIRTAEQLRLDWLQLHGRESNQTIIRVRRAGYKVIKAFEVNDALDWSRLNDSPADLRMLDNEQGGTGRPFDWQLVPVERLERLVLAGGVSTANLRAGLRLVRPDVVDVNSGVESAPGIKHKLKLQQFFKMVNRERSK